MMRTGTVEQIARGKGSAIFGLMWSILFIGGCGFAAAQGTDSGEEGAFAAKLEELTTTVYCYCGCERETIEVCVCQVADRVENDFRKQLLAGQTIEDIRTAYLDTHGPQYNALMPAEGINLIAYTMPGVILVIIGGIAFAVLRRSRKQAAAETANQQVPTATLEKVESELEDFKRDS